MWKHSKPYNRVTSSPEVSRGEVSSNREHKIEQLYGISPKVRNDKTERNKIALK
jgi:hypothetical protein